MKRIIFTLCMSIFSFSFVVAQQDILLENFENGTIGFTTMVNINPVGSMEATIVDNPVKAGINTSNKVWQWKRVATATDSPNWAGFWATLTNEIPAGYNRIEVKYLRTNANSQLRLKVEGSVTKEINPITPATKVNEWEKMVFDLAGNGIQNIKVLSLFPDYFEPVDKTTTTYVDDIMVYYNPATGIADNPFEANKLNAYYANGEIRFDNYTGYVKVFDLIGRLVKEGNAINGTFSVNLDKGIYILSTTAGSAKIVLP
jgi:hypothetical protein